MYEVDIILLYPWLVFLGEKGKKNRISLFDLSIFFAESDHGLWLTFSFAKSRLGRCIVA